MSFNSLPFLGALPFVVVAYWVLPQRHRWLPLLMASYGFCTTCAPTFLLWITSSTLVTYALGRGMGWTSHPAGRKVLLALGVVSNLGLLFALKYLGFADEILRALFDYVGLTYRLTAPNLLLPVGISFYTLQSVGYLLDVYRGNVEPEKHLGFFALFTAFFAKLAAGPIERAGHLIPQFREIHSLDTARLFSGLRLMLWGMFKKVVIADRLAVYVNAVFGDPGGHTGWTIVIATLFSAAHIYSDFSGYSDIAVGVARLFGLELIQNFRQPYLASSVSDFWRRWHVSLSSWLRDYVYIPLGGSRVARWRRDLNVLIVFLVSGLWHGADWTFVLWGALHGLYIVLEGRGKSIFDRLARVFRLEHTAVRAAIGIVTTFLLVSFSWIFFYARSVPDALLLIRNMVRFGSGTDVLAPWAGLTSATMTEMVLAWGLIGLLALVHLGRDGRLPRATLVAGRIGVRWAAYLLLALAIMNLGVANELPFVYAGF
ncbi:MAG: MBOAT family protein [Anaerolineae bacterium]|nr:MBOAT family protein [Anaerolineae bacterium]